MDPKDKNVYLATKIQLASFNLHVPMLAQYAVVNKDFYIISCNVKLMHS